MPATENIDELTSLKRSRRGTLSSVTAKRREIERLMSDPCNLELVKSEIEKLCKFFANFRSLHDTYVSKLEDEEEVEKSNQYFHEINESFACFQDRINEWIEQTSYKLRPRESLENSELAKEMVVPGDSVSQVQRTRVSGKSNSRQSSLSSVRAKEAMKLAELQAEFRAQTLKHNLEKKELNLKLERENLNLKLELDKADARGKAIQALVKEEEGKNVKVDVEPVNLPSPMPSKPLFLNPGACLLNLA